METNCYLYSDGKKECIVIDPGGSELQIVSSINMLKMIPSGIVLTHGHFDHTASAGKLKQFYGKDEIDIPIAIHKADRNFLGKKSAKTNRETLKDLGLNDPDEFADFFSDLPEPDIILKEGDTVFNQDQPVVLQVEHL